MIRKIDIDVNSFSTKRAENDSLVWVGLDIGGTKVAAVSSNARGEIQNIVQEKTRKKTPSDLLIQIVDIVENLVAPDQHLVSLGIGLPGQVNTVEGHTFSPFNLGWPNAVQIRQPLQDKLGVPVYIDNDLNTAIMAELTQGIGRQKKNFCYITIGTGVAAGLVFDGQVFRGAHYLAGELGHVVVDPNGHDCVCGSKGCLEALVSGPGIVRRYNEAVDSADHVNGAEAVFLAARNGDPHALSVVRNTARYLAIGINNLVAIVDPEFITIGGGVSDSGDILFPLLQEYLDKWMSGVIDKQVQICPATYRSQTGVVGALMLAHQNYMEENLRSSI